MTITTISRRVTFIVLALAASSAFAQHSAATTPAASTPAAADKCDAEFLNSKYEATAYRYRVKNEDYDAGVRNWAVYPLPTVSMNKLPETCPMPAPIAYVGRPLQGGFWADAASAPKLQAEWESIISRSSKGWEFGWQMPGGANARVLTD